MLPERLVPAEPRRGGPFSATRFFVSLFDQSKSEEMKRMKMRMGRRMNAIAMLPDWIGLACLGSDERGCSVQRDFISCFTF